MDRKYSGYNITVIVVTVFIHTIAKNKNKNWYICQNAHLRKNEHTRCYYVIKVSGGTVTYLMRRDPYEQQDIIKGFGN